MDADLSMLQVLLPATPCRVVIHIVSVEVETSRGVKIVSLRLLMEEEVVVAAVVAAVDAFLALCVIFKANN